MLGNFMDLVGVFIGSHFLQICRNEKNSFLNNFKECLQNKRDPLFESMLGFDDDKLCMVPKKNQFFNEITKSIQNIERNIIKSSKILDFEGPLRDVEKYGFKIKKMLDFHSNSTEDVNKEESDETLKLRDPEAYYNKILDDGESKNLPVKKPILNYVKDYDESTLNNKFVLPFEEKQLKIDNFILLAQANPLRNISFEGILINE